MSLVLHYTLTEKDRKQNILEWQSLCSFNELFLSWNGTRPEKGAYTFSISLLCTEWSCFFPYAQWETDSQKSFTSSWEHIRVFQDTVEITSGCATGVRIRVEAHNTTLHNLDALILSASHTHASFEIPQLPKTVFSLPIPPRSQMRLAHPRASHMCSPTATSSVVEFLTKRPCDPLAFAHNVWDKGFDIFGNWVFNVAQASCELGPSYRVWVTRLPDFAPIIEHLHRQIPTVVSIRGPLKNSPQEYFEGHLVAVIGYDGLQEKIYCMDPAFPEDGATVCSYMLNDFLNAWYRRGRIAYVFTLSNSDTIH